MDKKVIIALTVTVVLLGWVFWLVSAKSDADTVAVATPTALLVEGKQIVDISAKGGYSPRVIMAKAGVPTTLRIKTNATFDCSASVVIPKLSYQKIFQPTETEEIAISAEQARGTLQGLCSMGMYNFQIKFE